MRALVTIALLAGGGCALTDGLSGDGDDDGDGSGSGSELCTATPVERFLASEATGTISSVTLLLTVSHRFPTEVIGDLTHDVETAPFEIRGESGTVQTYEFPSSFSGTDATGSWMIRLKDTSRLDAGTWDDAQLVVCADSCVTTSDFTALDLPDCE